MKLFKIPFSIFALAFVLNITNACSTSSTNDETETAVNNSMLQRAGDLSATEAIRGAAQAIYDLSIFLERNQQLYSDRRSEIATLSEENLIRYLTNNNFQDVELIRAMQANYVNYMENVNHYIASDKARLNITTDEDTPTFIELEEQVMQIHLNELVYSGGGPDCLTQWENDMQDCRDVALIGSVGSILAAAGGIVPGLIGAGLTMAEFTRCKRAAQRDYNLCMQ